MIRSLTGAAGAILAATLAWAAPASAGAVYDTTLAAPGFYNGTGNPGSEFTVDTESAGTGTIELGLRARYRGGPDVTPFGSDYSFPTGSVVGHPGYALWNYDFSINLEDSGLHIADISGYTTLTVTDVSTGMSETINPLTYWADDASYAAGPVIYQSGGGSAFFSTLLGVQNSENLGFGDSPLAGDFDPTANDTYNLLLAINDPYPVAGGPVYAADYMTVMAGDGAPAPTPEPSTLWIMLASLGLFVVYRRRQHSLRLAA